MFQMTKSVTCPDELGALASQVTGDYSQLAVQGRLAAHTAEPEEVRVAWVAPQHRLTSHECGGFLSCAAAYTQDESSTQGMCHGGASICEA